jgi:hypothetical protein
VHFHELPSAIETTDLDLPSLHPLEVYSTHLLNLLLVRFLAEYTGNGGV